jgi:hypothetical protein
MTDRLDKLMDKAETLPAQADGIAVVVVRWKNLRCFPEKLVVKNKTQAILWVTDADNIRVDPIPGLTITPDGAYSRADPANAPMAEKKYSGTLTKGTQRKQFDPRLEVVP